MKISILEYSAAWDRAFRSERHRLAVALHSLKSRIEHIGSTAVPGLAAKPVIDIMIGLGRESGLDALIGPVTALGYEYVREYKAMMPFRRFFRRNGEGGMSFHLHAVAGDTLFWQDHLLFRDLLRNKPELHTAYEALKKELAKQEWPSGNDYAAAKGEFIRAALAAGRLDPDDATGRVVYQVSTIPLAAGDQLRPYYLQRYTEEIEAAMAAIAAGEDALLDHCSAEGGRRLPLPHEFPALGPEQLTMMIVLEALFELVRRHEAPHLPSRLKSIFTWPERELAHRFRDAYVPGGIIHRCVIRSGSALDCDGALLPPGINLDVPNQSALADEVRRVRQRALRYWHRAHAPEFPELLVNGDVEVLGHATGLQ
ncbi:GrpB family protein [Trichlorobacter ammonificans]|uniref:GrpB family protein n=1 Tax=Trichlorobacter ammonificans TaxID=2916410 RepID=A0ABN8HHG2_9BACT|nr:GrpB family protein [Trichlorobacter ammonificans]CAH2032271.1 conserved protein of unknown function [Trichlorobacter ammonificans]